MLTFQFSNLKITEVIDNYDWKGDFLPWKSLEWVSSRVGEQDGMLENIVDCILTTPSMLKEEHRYELILLVR